MKDLKSSLEPNSPSSNRPSRPRLISSSQHSIRWFLSSFLFTGSFWGYQYILLTFIIFAASGQWNTTLTNLLGVWTAGLLVGICITIWYGWDKIFKISFAWRSFGFTISFYICLSSCYFGFGLLNTNIRTWIIFTIFYVIITAISIVFTWFHEKKTRNTYRIQLKKYQTFHQQKNTSSKGTKDVEAIENTEDTFDETTDVTSITSDKVSHAAPPPKSA